MHLLRQFFILCGPCKALEKAFCLFMVEWSFHCFVRVLFYRFLHIRKVQLRQFDFTYSTFFFRLRLTAIILELELGYVSLYDSFSGWNDPSLEKFEFVRLHLFAAFCVVHVYFYQNFLVRGEFKFFDIKLGSYLLCSKASHSTYLPKHHLFQ